MGFTFYEPGKRTSSTEPRITIGKQFISLNPICIEKYFKGRGKTIIFAVLADKDYKKMLGEVIKVADRLILTTSQNSRSLRLDDLQRQAALIIENRRKNTDLPGEVYTIDTVKNSLNYALKISGTNDIIGITGSITNLEHLNIKKGKNNFIGGRAGYYSAEYCKKRNKKT